MATIRTRAYFAALTTLNESGFDDLCLSALMDEDITANGRSLIGAANYAAMRALLDLEAGTDFLSPAAIAAAYQPLHASLTAVAGVTVTAAGTALLDDANAAAQRTTLGMSANGSSLVSAADYAAMRALLDLEAGTDFLSPAAIAAAYQPLDSDLTTIAANITAAGHALLDDADATAQRATLGLVIGTNVQAFDAELAALAGLVSAADRLPYFTGSGTASLATFTTAARALLDDADAATMLATLGAMPLAGGTFSGTVTMADAVNLVFNTGTGTKFGTATDQKIGFFNATPVVQQGDPGAYTASGVYATDSGNIQSQFQALRTTLRNLGFWN